MSTLIQMAPKTASGVFGISDSSGAYRFYSTLTLAMAAATAGQTIEMFADVVETGAVEINLKNGVTINGNGHTYTLNNSGVSCALRVPVTVSTSCNILNLNVIRTGSTSIISDNACLVLGINGSGTINCTGSTFRNSGSGCGIVFNTNSTHVVNNATAYATTTYGAIGMYTSAGARCYNSTGIATSGGVGIRCHNGGDIANCVGTSDSGWGIYGLAGSQFNCTGISSTGAGFFSSSVTSHCVGRSISGVGFDNNNSNTIFNCTGISVSGFGFSSSTSTHNCTGISSSNSGCNLAYSSFYNVTARSSTNTPIFHTNGSAQLYGATLICEWNNLAGYGIRGNAGLFFDTLVNCTFVLANASAPYLFNGGIAKAISMRGNTYRGGAAFNANLTQAVTNTEDAQGNIYL